MKVKYTLSIGYPPGRAEIVELDDDATDEEIERDYQDWVSNYMDGTWRKVEETES